MSQPPVRSPAKSPVSRSERPRPLALAALCLLVSWFAAPAEAGRPRLPTIPAAEEQRIREGKLWLTSERREGETLGEVVGVIEVKAPVEAIWKVLLDTRSITASSRAVQKVDVYGDQWLPDGTRRIDLAFLLKVGWSEVRYHTRRTYVPADHYMSWIIDKERANDILFTEGSYSTWPGASPGTHRLLYRTRVDTGKSIPQWLEEDLTESSLKRYLNYVKEEAERQSTP